MEVKLALLESGIIVIAAAAVLTCAIVPVTTQEPSIHAAKELDNVVLTPHIASATEETRAKMSELAADNLIAFFEGKEPPSIIK